MAALLRAAELLRRSIEAGDDEEPTVEVPTHHRCCGARIRGAELHFGHVCEVAMRAARTALGTNDNNEGEG